MSGRPREYDGDEVLEAAMQVFWDNGYEASSTQILCERTGLGRGSLYHAFGNKQTLYEKALLHYQELGIQTQKQILLGEGSAKNRLRAFLNWGIESDLNCDSPRGCLALHSVLERGGKDADIYNINRLYVARLETLIGQVIQEGIDANEFTATSSISQCTKAFLASYYGLRLLGQSVREGAFLHDTAEGIIARL